MDSNADNKTNRAPVEAAKLPDRPSYAGPVLGIVLLFVALLAMLLA